MAVEKALAWYEQLRATEEQQKKISNEIKRLCLSMSRKEFSAAGLSKAEIREKRAKIQKERNALAERHWKVALEGGPKPDFSGMTEVERAEAAERLRNNELAYARRLQADGDPKALSIEAFARILDFDPKQGGRYYNRFTLVDLTKFDLDEESPFGPMRFTDPPHKIIETKYRLCAAVNFLSVKVASSDIGLPIHVYGTVIVRDSIDDRCVYHFRRDIDHCQQISSEADSLILTGPKRGLVLFDYMYVEIDLKIKDHLGQPREFSKGLLSLGDPTTGASMVSMVKTMSLATRLSTVDVTYAVVDRAIEGFIAVEVVQGGFQGKITAYTTSIQDMLVLYDSKEAADAMTVEGCRDIQLMRSVISVHVNELLILVAQTSDGKSESIKFTPMINGRDEGQLTLGATKMRVKLAWSIMDP